MCKEHHSLRTTQHPWHKHQSKPQGERASISATAWDGAAAGCGQWVQRGEPRAGSFPAAGRTAFLAPCAAESGAATCRTHASCCCARGPARRVLSHGGGCSEGWQSGTNCRHVFGSSLPGPGGSASPLLALRSRGRCSDTVVSPCVLLPADIGLFRGGFLLALQLPSWRNRISVITLQIALERESRVYLL